MLWNRLACTAKRWPGSSINRSSVRVSYCPIRLNIISKAWAINGPPLRSKNDKIDAQGLSRLGLEQQLPVWKPLSKNLYQLRLLTRRHQRLQELKT
jgi:hypothetical protein